MNILFIHQNFPAQFRHLAMKLVGLGHEVTALVPAGKQPVEIPGVTITYYAFPKPILAASHPYLDQMQAQTIRGQGCFERSIELKGQGFEPDVIIAHPGWGEAMFIEDVWPHARKIIYCEFFYRADGQDVNFDPEFDQLTPSERAKLRLKNVASLLCLEDADVAISPTHWQASTFPEWVQQKITVLHDGVDTDLFCPDEHAQVEFDVGEKRVTFTAGMPLVTYVSRNLEPYRGFHTFLRSLVPLLRGNLDVQIAIVGGTDAGYGSERKDGKTWRDHYREEIRPQLSQEEWDRIHFLDRIPFSSYRRLLQCSMVHVYLTYPFVLSWSLLEAMSTGCAVVGSQTAPVEEVISDGQNGCLVDFFSPDAVSAAVDELTKNSELRRKLGIEARRTARERFDLNSVCLPKLVDLVGR